MWYARGIRIVFISYDKESSGHCPIVFSSFVAVALNKTGSLLKVVADVNCFITRLWDRYNTVSLVVP